MLAAENTEKAAAEVVIELYNRGKRTISGHVISGRDEQKRLVFKTDEHGNRIPFEFKAQRAQDFNQATADYLRSMFKGEVVSMADVKQEFTDKAKVPASEEQEFDARIDRVVQEKLAKLLEERGEAVNTAGVNTDVNTLSVDTEALIAAAVETAVKAERERIYAEIEAMAKAETEKTGDETGEKPISLLARIFK